MVKPLACVTTLLLAALLAVVVSGAPANDRVTALPGAPPLSAPTYSGYLNVTGTRRRLFYVLSFATSAPPDVHAPVLIWLNGGPGCSSLEGLLRENGPFLVNSDGTTLSANSYAYSNFANVLWLESPAGVGFTIPGGEATTNDEQTASDAMLAVQSFVRKFPSFATVDWFIAGESYAGIFIPMLAERLVASSVVPLKGIAVGNGVTSYAFNGNSLPPFLAQHDIITSTLWAALDAACAGSFFNPPNAQCAQLLGAAGGQVNAAIAAGLNPYGLYKPCARRSGDSGDHQRDFFSEVLLAAGFDSVDPPCYDPSSEEAYLGLVAVKAALHTDPDLPPWTLCSSRLNYTKTVQDITPTWKLLRAAGVRLMVYAGDTDMATNSVGNEQAVASLGLPVSTPRRVWSATAGQVDGFVQAYDGDNVVYATVKGAGHLVPQDRPAQALHLMTSFVRGQLP